MPSRNSTQLTVALDRLLLEEGPHIQGHEVQHNDPHRLLVIDGVVVPAAQPSIYSYYVSLSTAKGMSPLGLSLNVHSIFH